MTRKSTTKAEDKSYCANCHGDRFRRTIHLLDKFRHSRDDKLRHLRQEFPNDKSGFIDSEMRWQDFIVRNYAGKTVEEDGTNTPVWLAFARSKAKVTRLLDGRWRIS